MKAAEVALGQVVRVTTLSDTPIAAGPQYLEARKEGVTGRVQMVFREDDHALVWVEHGGLVAPYLPYELALVGIPVGWEES